jgi:hypothetical protein
MPFRLRRLIDAPAFTFAIGRAGLAAVDDPSSLKAVTTDDASALGASLSFHFPFLLVNVFFDPSGDAGSRDHGMTLPQLPITFNRG